LMIALLIQLLVIYDYLFNYVICSSYIIWLKNGFIASIVKKFSLKEVYDSFIDEYFWLIAIPTFLIEVIFCYISFYYFEKSLLFLSIFVWTISFVLSCISVTIINAYIRSCDDLQRALRLREDHLFLLNKEISILKIQWRTEEMEKMGDKFDESVITKRVEDYKAVKITVLDEILDFKGSWIIDQIDVEPGDEESEGTFWDAFNLPTQQNLINLFLYPYYLTVCCRDSEFLYNLIFSLLFQYPPIGQPIFPNSFYEPYISANHGDNYILNNIYMFASEYVIYVLPF